ncbi:MAG: phage tail protein I [Chloroflexia bacterium]
MEEVLGVETVAEAVPVAETVEATEPGRWIQYLPAIYQDNDFLRRFLRVPEEIVACVEEVLEEIHRYFDPRMAPPSFLPWLATWIDLALDENWPESRRRQLIHEGMELYRWRGTRRGMITYLRIYAGVEPEIVEHRTAAEGGPYAFSVILRVPDGASVDETRIRAIIEAEKPAHTTYRLQIEPGGS